VFEKARYLPATLLAASLAMPLGAQTTDVDSLRQEMESLKKGQEAIQKDLADIKKLLAARPAAQPQRNTNAVPPNTVIDLAGKPVKGSSDARLAVIEFLDYQ
jgi:hypothetical protein